MICLNSQNYRINTTPPRAVEEWNTKQRNFTVSSPIIHDRATNVLIIHFDQKYLKWIYSKISEFFLKYTIYLDYESYCKVYLQILNMLFVATCHCHLWKWQKVKTSFQRLLKRCFTTNILWVYVILYSNLINDDKM